MSGALVLVNGRVRTGDIRRPMADALAVLDGIVVLVGSSAEVRKLSLPLVRVIDLHGALVRPTVEDATLRRGVPASFVVESHAPTGAVERFRIHEGAVVVDTLGP
jgi:hypothetical protein